MKNETSKKKENFENVNMDKEQILKLLKLAKISVKEEKFSKISKDMQSIVDFALQISDSNVDKSFLENKSKKKMSTLLRKDEVKDSFKSHEILSGAIGEKDNFLWIGNSVK